MANIPDGALCTVAGTGGKTAGSCTNATSCCAAYAATTDAASAIANKLICFPAGTKKATAYTVTAEPAETTLAAKSAFIFADCPAATTGASTLAVSAAALATAVYMM